MFYGNNGFFMTDSINQIVNAESKNLISNSTFDRDTTGWNIYRASGGCFIIIGKWEISFKS